MRLVYARWLRFVSVTKILIRACNLHRSNEPAFHTRLLRQMRETAMGTRSGMTDTTMFFLLRMAFWLGLVLVLLPTDKSSEQTTSAPTINAVDAMSAAGAAMSDFSQFCARQPAACAVGGQAASVIGARAQNGARKVYQFIAEKRDHTGSIGINESHQASQDTLTDEDRASEWRLSALRPSQG